MQCYFFIPTLYFGLCIFCACFAHEALKCTASRETFARYSTQTNVNRAVYVVHANRKISQQPANGTTVTTHWMQCKCNLLRLWQHAAVMRQSHSCPLTKALCNDLRTNSFRLFFSSSFAIILLPRYK